MLKGYKEPKPVISVQGGDLSVPPDGIGSRIFKRMVFVLIPVAVITGFCVTGFILNKFERRHRFSVSQEQVVAATMPAE